MAWIEVKNIDGKTFTIPESVYKNSYEKSGVFTKVEKPKSINENKIIEEKEVVKDGNIEIQQHKQTKVHTSTESRKKARV